jgi:hypothetical protein
MLVLLAFTTSLTVASLAPSATPTPNPASTRPSPGPKRVAAATPTPVPKAPPAVVPFGDGERTTYNVAWSSMTAGTASLAVRAGRTTGGVVDSWHAAAEVTPSTMLSGLYTLAYKAETTFDASTLLPRSSLVDSLEGSRRRIRRTVFDHARKKAQYSVTIGDTVTRPVDIAAESQDILSIVYKIRTLPLASGLRQTIAVCDNGRRYTFDFTVGPKETLTTPMGQIAAFKIAPRVVGDDGKVEPSQKTLWFSADDRRLLLRAESTLTVGRVILDLASFTPGRP